MTHENEEQKPIDETTEDEARPVGSRVAQLRAYKALMIDCFHAAGDVILETEIMTGPGIPLVTIGYDVLPEIALALFNRCTREMPEQAELFSTALEHLKMLTKENEVPTGFVPVAPFVSSMPPCKHPQLAALRKVLLSSDGNSFSLIGDSVLAALSIEAFAFGHEGTNPVPALACPECWASVSVDKFKDGTLFSESEDHEKDSNEC